MNKYTAFHPGEVWLDTEGKPIQAHGGSVIFAEGKYWWYGENKEFTDGKSEIWTYGIRAYSSADLYNWDDEGLIIPPVLDDRNSSLHPEQYIDRPHILYNERTKKYVCWIKVMRQYPDQAETVLVADRMKGPWTIVREGYHPCGMYAGDFDLVKADDGKAYYYFGRPHTELICADLDEDYTGCTGYYSTHFPGRRPPFAREAPAYFTRNGKHYLFTSGTSGYWPNPTETMMADTFHGPWKSIGSPHNLTLTDDSFKSQISCVFRVQGTDKLIAMADRWLPFDTHSWPVVRDAFDKATSGRGDDPDCQAFWKSNPYPKTPPTRDARYVWLPVEFDGERPVLNWQDEWKIS